MINIIAPPEQLKPFVQYFWQAHFDYKNEESFTHIATASSDAGLQFYFEGGFSDSNNSSFKNFEQTAIFHGQTINAGNFTSSSVSSGIFGMKFPAFAIPYLFNLPAVELTGQMITLKQLLGKEANELAESIFLAKSFSERVKIMSIFLTKQLILTNKPDQNIIIATQFISEQKGDTNLEKILKTVFLSERHFERKFKQEVGMSPKSFAKIIRFEHVKHCIECSNKSLTEIAHSCGYYDQAHLNHDFKTLSGYNPKEFYKNYMNLKLIE